MMTTVCGKAARTFQRGRSTYVCGVCDRRTRETTVSGSDVCAECYELAGHQNSVWDACADEWTVKERDTLLKVIAKRGGNVEKVKDEFSELFDFKMGE